MKQKMHSLDIILCYVQQGSFSHELHIKMINQSMKKYV